MPRHHLPQHGTGLQFVRRRTRPVSGTDHQPGKGRHDPRHFTTMTGLRQCHGQLLKNSSERPISPLRNTIKPINVTTVNRGRLITTRVGPRRVRQIKNNGTRTLTLTSNMIIGTHILTRGTPFNVSSISQLKNRVFVWRELRQTILLS